MWQGTAIPQHETEGAQSQTHAGLGGPWETDATHGSGQQWSLPNMHGKRLPGTYDICMQIFTGDPEKTDVERRHTDDHSGAYPTDWKEVQWKGRSAPLLHATNAGTI